MKSQRVEIVGAPGFMNFQAQAIPGLHRYRINDSCPLVSVVADLQGELFVIPSEYVLDVEDRSFAVETGHTVWWNGRAGVIVGVAGDVVKVGWPDGTTSHEQRSLIGSDGVIQEESP